MRNAGERKEAAMPSCPECENELDVELDEVEEGDVVACDECGTEYEVVGVEPLELARVDGEIDEEDEPFQVEEDEE
jgi:alpha-aminoadipate carrier protein LysW